MKPIKRKNLFLLLSLLPLLAMMILPSLNKNMDVKEITFSEFIDLVKAKNISDVIYDDQKDSNNVTITANTVDKVINKTEKIKVDGPGRSEVYVKLLLDNGIVPNPKKFDAMASFTKAGSEYLPFILVNLLFGLFLFWMIGSQLRSSKKFAAILGPSKSGELSGIKFSDVAGIDESKAELEDYVRFLKEPEKFTSLGGRLPRGALLVGPPGVGKTLMAKAIAGEAGVPFFSISGSEFVELFVGVGPARVRSLFKQARKAAPCIIFIDEIDAIARARSSNPLNNSNSESEKTLNQMLVEMDGFEASSGVIVLAATNRAETLDAAILRPGRFDRQVYISLPDVKGREAILKTHAKNVKVDGSVDFSIISKETSGMSGADLACVVNEAALIAARHGKNAVEHSDFEAARNKIIMGVERKSLVLSEKDKLTTAYHEIGHALISRLIPELDPVHQVSIIPRGMALGVTQTISRENELTLSKSRAEAMIVMFMGGRAAEELAFGHFTTGASNDLERASKLAKKMVCEWGMSDLFGARSFSDMSNSSNAFPYSHETLKAVEDAISAIVNNAYTKAKLLLSDNALVLKKLSLLLLSKENLTASELDDFYKQHGID